jgi:hypothetical protein
MDVYYYATLRDACSATFTPYTNLREFRLGRVYSQVYLKTKVNFVVLTVETFTKTTLETLALDPDYVKNVQYLAYTTLVSLLTQKIAYIRSKNRAYRNLLNAARLLFSIRYEERLQARLWKAVLAELVILKQEPAAQEITKDGVAELLYYIVLSQTFFRLIRGQVNKFCLGFEYTLWTCSLKYTK